MTKNEFLSVLRGRITGSIPTREVESQIDYYAAYIDGRIGAGLTEEEAVDELGDPRLIAKTVIESVDRAAEAAGYDGPYRSSTDSYDDSDGINTGEFGNSGPYRMYGAERAEEPYSQQHSGYSQQSEQTRSGDQSGQGQQGSSFSSGTGLGCIIAVIILVLIMALGWVLTALVFRISFRLLGWFFPIIAVTAIIVLVISLVRRRR